MPVHIKMTGMNAYLWYISLYMKTMNRVQFMNIAPKWRNILLFKHFYGNFLSFQERLTT